MRKETVSIKIGEKQLTFEAEPGNVDHRQFAAEMKAVAAQSPQSLQDFICKLVEVQKRTRGRVVKNPTKSRRSNGL